MARAEYKFKPYTPVNLKMASPKGASLTKDEKLLKSLQTQRDNLDERLRAEGIDPDTLGGAFDNRNIIEKALNLTPDQGPLMDFFEIINRPVQAIKGTIAAGVEGKNPLVGAWEGISGRYDEDGAEFLETLGIDVPDEGIGRFAASLGVDIALDPLTYLPAGFFTKKIGRLLSRNKNIITSELVGEGMEALAKAGVVAADGAAFKNWDDLIRNIDSLDDVAKQDAITKVRQAIDDPKNEMFFRKGTADDYLVRDAKGKRGAYRKSYEGLQARRKYLTDLQNQIDIIKNNDALPLTKRDEQVAKLLKEAGYDKVSSKGLGNGVAAELELAKELDGLMSDLGPNFSVVATSTGNNMSDVSIVRKLRIGDEDVYVKLISFDAKQGAGAYLANPTLKFADNGDLVFGGTDFADAQFGLKQNLQKIKVKGLKGPDGSDIDNLYDAISEFGKRAKSTVRGGNTINPFDFVDEQGKAALNDYFRKINRTKFDNGEGWLYLRDLDGKGAGVFVKYKDAERFLDFSKSTFQKGTRGAAKTAINAAEVATKRGKVKKTVINKLESMGFDLTGVVNKETGELLDSQKLGDFVQEFNEKFAGKKASKSSDYRMTTRLGINAENYKKLIEQTASNKVFTTSTLLDNIVTKSQTSVRVGLLDFLEDKDGFVGELAKVTNRFVKYIKSKFSLYGFIPDELETAVRRLSGENAVAYQTKMRRLAALQDSFEKAFPGQSRTLSQLVEMGASLDDAGRLVLAPRTHNIQEYWQHILRATDEGRPIQLRKFGSRQAETRFLNILEDATGNQNNFKIVTKKNGAKVLETNLTKSELIEALEVIKIDANLKDLVLDFGKMNPTPEQLKMLKEWDGYNEFVTIKNDVQKLLVDEGGFTQFLDSYVNDTYLRHIMTKDAYEYMAKNQPGVLSKFAKPGSNVFSNRKFLGTIDEVNEYLQAIYDIPMDVIDNNAFRATEDFFTKAFRNIEQGKLVDVLLSSKDKYGRGLIRVVDNTQDIRKSLSSDDIMFKTFTDEFNPLFKNLSEDGKKGLQNYLTRNGFVEGKAIVMNRTMHSILKRAQSAFIDLPAFVKVYDKYLNTWKGLTLITPGFHMRNLFGNSFNSYAVGMGLPAQMRYARIASLEFDEYAKAAKILAEGGTLNAKQQKIFDLMSEFQASGLIQSHRGVRDLEQVKEMTEEALKKRGGSKLLRGYNQAVRFNFNVAEKMDDMQRYMLWRWSLDKTGDSVKASKTVAKSLFDYSNLTGFEKDVMKRVFPFYTFMKNNFIFQAKNIFVNPAQYAKTGRAYKAYLEDIAGYSPEDLPDYAVDNMWLPIPMMVTKNDKDGIAFLKANLPITDFTELVSDPFKKGVVSVTVPVKLAIELGAGRDLFTGAPLQEFPGQTSTMQPGTGVFASIRDPRGNLIFAQTPLMQKILNDIGFRTPLNVASAGLDVVDSMMGYQGPASGLSDVMQRAGVAGVQELDRIELTRLYQDLERLRELKKYYEQETGNQLPVLPRG